MARYYRRRFRRRTNRGLGRPRSRFSRLAYRGRSRFRNRGRRFTINKTYAFQRTHRFTITTLNNSDTPGGMDFALANVSGYDEFTVLFERYQIRGISIQFRPRQSENTSATVNPGIMYFVRDYDDAVNPTSLDTLLQRQGVQERRLVGNPWKLYLKPRAALNIYNGSTAPDAHAPMSRGSWLSCENPSTPHYGVKYLIPNTGVTYNIDVILKYYLVFTGVR